MRLASCSMRPDEGRTVLYRFPDTPELEDLTLDVRAASGRLSFTARGTAPRRVLPAIHAYFAWLNSIHPVGLQAGAHIYSLYVPPVPSGAHAHQLEDFLRSQLFRRRRPTAATLAVTAACQLSCPHCSAAMQPSGHGSLTTQTWRRVIHECVDLGTSVVTFTGGEPLLRRDLEELVAAVPRERAVAEFFCNGLEATDDRLNALRKASAYGVHLSLDDPDPAEHDRLRGRAGVFEAVERAARAARRTGLLVGLSTFATNESVDERKLSHIAALGDEWGASEVSVFDGIRTGRLLRSCTPLLDAPHRRSSWPRPSAQPRPPGAAARHHAVLVEQRPRVHPADRLPRGQPAVPHHGARRVHALRLHATLVRQRAGASVAELWRRQLEHPAYRNALCVAACNRRSSARRTSTPSPTEPRCPIPSPTPDGSSPAPPWPAAVGAAETSAGRAGAS